MVNKGGFAAIDSVEFYRMGQAGIMARYPFHWHVVGDAPGQFIKNSSVHASFQRCITIHKTNKTLVENNVCYDFLGHGFFLEDGTEIDNVLRGNIGIYVCLPRADKLLLSSDNPDGNASVVSLWLGFPRRPRFGFLSTKHSCRQRRRQDLRERVFGWPLPRRFVVSIWPHRNLRARFWQDHLPAILPNFPTTGLTPL